MHNMHAWANSVGFRWDSHKFSSVIFVPMQKSYSIVVVYVSTYIGIMKVLDFLSQNITQKSA